MSKKISYLLPYGEKELELLIESQVVKSAIFPPQKQTETVCQDAVVTAAMENPINSKRLRELSVGRKNAVIIISDHTRPVPSKFILPHMLSELRCGNSNIDITLLVATGCHRTTTKRELINKLGEQIYNNEKILVHDCLDEQNLVDLGSLPSGARLIINRLAANTDLLVSEGFIEPHFFAGFSGGRKSVLPGVCSLQTVLGNHCGEFISHPNARAGVMEGNPVNIDMCAAAKMAGLEYIVNVVIDRDKKAVAAFAGEPAAAHKAGCEHLMAECVKFAPLADVTIVTNGGYPLDQNVYQCVKGMTAAHEITRPGGVIIMLAECRDGHGGEAFFEIMKNASSPDKLFSRLSNVPMEKTIADQWQAQILARILTKHIVVMVTKCSADQITQMKMRYARDINEALAIARSICGSECSFNIIRDGVSIIAKELS